MFFKKIREAAGVNPRGVNMAHEINDHIWVLIDLSFGHECDVERSIKIQGFIHGVIACFASVDRFQEKGIEKAALGEFYRINFPGSWRNIVNSIASNINSSEYQEGINLGVSEMENAAKFS
tara:strand:+ start:2469 stop:2831 length:363 start_codon:yes stop_codon:yes gene_type:complete